MPGEFKNGMQCGEFEALLAEALDQTLTGQKLESFQAHGRVCSVCGPMFAEADAGRRWLKGLQEVKPPANLVHNILAATSGREVSQATQDQPQLSWVGRMWRWAGGVVGPAFTVARQPRFAMSAAMAFFLRRTLGFS